MVFNCTVELSQDDYQLVQTKSVCPDFSDSYFTSKLLDRPATKKLNLVCAFYS